MLRPTRIEVYRENILWNYRAVKTLVPGNCEVMAVLKANAYALGLLPVAELLASEGCRWFAVATPEEALKLKQVGLKQNILVLGPAPIEAAEPFVRHGISATCADLAFAQKMDEAAKAAGHPAKVHIKIDTGLNRIGFRPEKAEKVFDTLAGMEELKIEGIFTHFATADDSDPEYTRWQFEQFSEVLERFGKMGLPPVLKHCSNSAGTVNFPEMALDAVRVGAMLYGLRPGFCARPVDLRPVFSLKTALASVREIPARSGVGYDLSYMCPGKKKLGVLPLGYYDGLSPSVLGQAQVLVRGKKVPVVGKVCMDQTILDLSGLPEACCGDEVVVIGGQGKESISIEDVARREAAIPARVMGHFSERVPRVYM